MNALVIAVLVVVVIGVVFVVLLAGVVVWWMWRAPPETQETPPGDWRDGLRGLDDAARLDHLQEHLQPGLIAVVGHPTTERTARGLTWSAHTESGALEVRLLTDGRIAHVRLAARGGAVPLVLRTGRPSQDRSLARRDLGKTVFVQPPDAELPAWIEHWETFAKADRSALLLRMRDHRVASLAFESETLTLVPDPRVIERSIPDPGALLGAWVDTLLHAAQTVAPTLKEAVEPQPVDPVVAAMAGYDDLGTGRHDAAATVLLEAVGEWLDNPVYRLPSDNDDAAEVRGRLGELPYKFVMNEFGDWHVEVMVNVTGHATLQYDPNKSPVIPKDSDDWADDDAVRMFVADGVYLEGDDAEIEGALPLIQRLPTGVLDALAKAFPALELIVVSLGATTELSVGRTLSDHPDPVAAVRAVTDCAVQLGIELGAGKPTDLRREVCAFCEARYFFGVYRERCPNCGAPPG